MENQTKLPEELLLEIQQLRDELTENVLKIGRLNVQVSFYEKDLEIFRNELNKLYEEAAKISVREEEMQNRVIKEYGDGKLDFESGVFHPNN
jgi:hypothetical protein